MQPKRVCFFCNGECTFGAQCYCVNMHVCALKLTLECSVVVCTFQLMSCVHVPIYVHVQMISEPYILYILNYVYIILYIYV